MDGRFNGLLDLEGRLERQIPELLKIMVNVKAQIKHRDARAVEDWTWRNRHAIKDARACLTHIPVTGTEILETVGRYFTPQSARL